MNFHGNGEKNRSRILVFLCLIAASNLWPQEIKEAPAVTASKAFKLSGYTQILCVTQDEGLDSFSIKRARLSFAGELLKNVRFKLQIDAVKSPVLVDAQLDFVLNPIASFRVGQFKVPFSQESLLSASEVETINRSQPVTKLSPGQDIGSSGRDIGAMFFGKYAILEYTVGFFNGAGINKTDTNEQKDLAARFLLRPAGFLSIAASFYDGRYSEKVDAPAVARKRTGFETAVVHDAFSLKGEFILAKDDTTSKQGWYLQGGYFVLAKTLQAIVKYDSYDKDKNVAGDRSHLFTVGMNWFLTEKTKLMVNFELYRDESGKTTNSALLAQFQAGF
jgi:phosphate-selective porin OprO/OprP